MPVWLLFVFMCLATYRCTRLVVKDDFPPVLWARDRLVGGWRPLTTAEQETVRAQPGGNQPFPMQEIDGIPHRWNTRRSWSPAWLADLISCPWCASGWVSLIITLYTWAITDGFGWTALLLWWLAVWASASLIASKSWA